MIYFLLLIVNLLSIVSIALFIYSIINLIKKRKKSIIKSKIYIYIGYILFLLYNFLLFEFFLKYLKFYDNKVYTIIYLLIISVGLFICCLLLFRWNTFELYLDGNNIVFKNNLKTTKLKISHIDKKRSVYYCIIPRGKRSFSSQILELYDDVSFIKIKMGLFTAGNEGNIIKFLIIDLKIKREVYYK